MSFNLGCRRSCLCSKSLPDSSSKTDRAPRTGGAGVHHKSRKIWDTYDGQFEMAALSRLRILYDELLAVRSH